jgi:hypothetical protein
MLMKREHGDSHVFATVQGAEDAAPILGGSSVGRKKSKSSQRLERHVMLYNDYFSNDPTYNAQDFLHWSLR